MKAAERRRLYVGGLVENVTDDEIRQRFARFGEVLDVDIHNKTNNGTQQTFAYINIEASQQNVTKCIQVYDKCKWKGKELQIQVAKESFLERLKRERAEQEQAATSVWSPYRDLGSKPAGGEKEGATPVLHLRDKTSQKVCKIDPSAHTKLHKRLEGDEPLDTTVDKLTWEIEEKPNKRGTPASRPTEGLPKQPPRLPASYGIQGNGTVEFGSDSDSDSCPVAKVTGRSYDSSDDGESTRPSAQKTHSKRKGTGCKRTAEASSSEDSDSDQKRRSKKSRTPSKTSEESSSKADNQQVESSIPGWLDSESDGEQAADNKPQKRPSKSPETASKLAKNKTTAQKKADKIEKGESVDKARSSPPKRQTADSYAPQSSSRRRHATHSSGDDDSDMDVFDIIAAGKVKSLYKDTPQTGKRDKAKKETTNTVKDTSKELVEEKPKKTKKEKQDTKPADKGVHKCAIKKHEVSNEKRLEGLMVRQKEALAQKSLLQKALSQVDAGSSTKKVVFDSEDEDEKMADAGEISYEPLTTATKRPVLFESGSDDDSGSDTEFIRPEFEGKSGTKMLKLQAKFSSDPRFKLDARFVEDDSGDSEEEAESVPAGEGEKERTRDMEILRSVVGTAALLKNNKTAKTPFRDINALQYDPNKADHQKFEIQPEKKTKKQKKKEKVAATPEVEDTLDLEPEPEVSAERFYEVTSSLKDAFGVSEAESSTKGARQQKGEGSTGFSLLSVFGEEGEGKPSRKQAKDKQMEVKTKESLFPWQQSLEYGGSSEEEDSDVEEDAPPVEPEKPVIDVFKPKRETFFFADSDPSIQEALAFFCTKDAAGARKSWLEKKPALTENYLKRRKRALREERDAEKTDPKRQRRQTRTKPAATHTRGRHR